MNPTQHTPRTKVGRMEMGHEPSDHAVKILKSGVAGNAGPLGSSKNGLTSDVPNFGQPAAGGRGGKDAFK